MLRILLALLVSAAPLFAETLEQALADTLHPYTGETATAGAVDRSTLTRKLMCGYQGWFNCEGDGANRGWVHWTKKRGAPTAENIKVDLWPDLSEYGPEERFDTGLHHADGRAAQVFSSYKSATVLRHFQWMRDYGIDGAFIQRFPGGARSPDFQRQNNTVLAHCREGANRSGRAYALMYDLTGLGAGKIGDVIEDFRALRTRMKIGADASYLRHRGKPLVAIWGVGFNDKRAYTLDDCRRLVDFVKNDPEAGGCSVMLGIPTYWRELKNDALSEPALHDLLSQADVLSPWTVGRYGKPSEAERHAEKLIVPDIAWCAEHRLDYLPVVFPGFSWHNMYGAALNSIPRLKGEFLWSQVRADKRAGATMLYVAMFDEVDEGTAVFKCTNDVPTEAPFVTLEGLPSDFYLKLCGQAAKFLRGELPADAALPTP